MGRRAGTVSGHRPLFRWHCRWYLAHGHNLRRPRCLGYRLPSRLSGRSGPSTVLGPAGAGLRHGAALANLVDFEGLLWSQSVSRRRGPLFADAVLPVEWRVDVGDVIAEVHYAVGVFYVAGGVRGVVGGAAILSNEDGGRMPEVAHVADGPIGALGGDVDPGRSHVRIRRGARHNRISLGCAVGA